MGKTTTERIIPEAGVQEKIDNATINAIITEALKAEGFDLQQETTTVPANPAKIESLEAQVQDLTDQLQFIDDQIAKTVRGIVPPELITQRAVTATRLSGLNTQLAKERENTTTDVKVTLTEREDPRVQALIDKRDTAGADALRIELDEADLKKLGDEDEIAQLTTDAIKKFLSGDLSITPEQEKELKDSTERIREPVLKALNEIDAEIDRTEGSVASALDNLFKQIENTGLSVEEALTEAEARVKETGGTLLEALDETVRTSRKLGEQKLFKQTRDLRNKISLKATVLGRSDLDPAFIRELNESTLDAITTLEFSLFAQQAVGVLGIEERTGGKLEAISLLRAELRGELGLRKEDVEKGRTALAETSGLRRETVGGLRADFAERLSTKEEEQRFALAQGLPLAQLRAGADVQAGGRAEQASFLQGIGFPATLAATQAGTAANLRGAAGTTTTTTPGGSIFGKFLSVLGTAGKVGASVATVVAASDVRFKEDIVRVGESVSGLTIYEFAYKGQPGRYRGVMAQEVLKHTPSAVLADDNGYLAVDYAQIDVPFKSLQ